MRHLLDKIRANPRSKEGMARFFGLIQDGLGHLHAIVESPRETTRSVGQHFRFCTVARYSPVQPSHCWFTSCSLPLAHRSPYSGNREQNTKAVDPLWLYPAVIARVSIDLPREPCKLTIRTNDPDVRGAVHWAPPPPTATITSHFS